MKTIAQEAEEFLSSCYAPEHLNDPEVKLEFEMIFHSGFTACLHLLVQLQGKSYPEITGAIFAYMEETKQFAYNYMRAKGVEP